MTTKQKPTIGSVRFSVNWTANKDMPVNEFGDCDRDGAKESRATFGTLAEAAKFAQSKIGLGPEHDCFGCIEISRQVVEVDEEILEVEGRRVLTWAEHEAWIVDDANGEPILNESF